MNGKDISNLRINYHRFSLSEKNLPENPIELFQSWFNDAVDGQIKEPNAMIISTVSEDGRPHSRVVLLKSFSEEGFEFFTNYKSLKGRNISGNPYVALTFFYDKLERQIRIEGKAQRLDSHLSDEYFHSRPRGSQIGAWVSHQSEIIASRDVLEQKLAEYESKFNSADPIPRPDFWGGFLVVPDSIEFWQGRPNRLHDRILYQKDNENWKISRLSP